MTDGASKTNGNGSLNRASLYVSLVTAGAIVVGAFIWVGSIASQVTQNASDIRSMSARLAQAESDIRGLQVAYADVHQKDCQTFAKIETQMGTVETIINEIHVAQVRDHGTAWKKLFDEDMPPVYYEIKIPHDVMPC